MKKIITSVLFGTTSLLASMSAFAYHGYSLPSVHLAPWVGQATGVTLVLLIVAALFLYFLPAIIANNRKHTNTGAIFFTNLLFGWTFIGWIFSYIWALTTTTGMILEREHTRNTRKCPACAELIQKDARVCRYCGNTQPV